MAKAIRERGAGTREPVGVIGLGIMGSAIAANVRAAGLSVLGYDVLAPRRAAAIRAGVRAQGGAGEVAKEAPIVITSLPSAQALHDVAAKIAACGRRGQIVIETSTLPIEDKEAARRVLARRGVTLLDCPLSGTGAQAKARDLVVLASGDRAAYQRVVPVLEAFARAHYFLGTFGAGSKMKFVANLLVAIHNVSTAEALVLGMKAGLDGATMVKVLSDGAGSSRMLQVRGPMMVDGEYSEAAMKVGVWQKDMKIIDEFARALDCPTPLFAATTPIYNAAMALGFGDADTASVCAVLEKWAMIRRGKSATR
jgi:3-hydroxyisobutyrate dehydrogenase-like beta-hydroxyacid dehydrogenase